MQFTWPTLANSASLGRHEVLRGQGPASYQVVLVGLDPGHGNVGRGSAADAVQPDGDVGQGHALNLGDRAGVANANWKARDLAAVIQLVADHVYGKALVGAGQHLETLAVLVVVFDGGRHPVDKVVFFVQVLREKDPHALVHICGGPLQGPNLFQPRALIVFQIGLIVEEDVPNGPLVAVLEECFHGNFVGLGTRLAAARDDDGVVMLPEELQEVVGHGIVGGPSTVASKDLLFELLHAWLPISEDAQLLLQSGALATHLLVEVDGPDVLNPSLAGIATGHAFLHHGKLPKVAQQNEARQLVCILPHSQNALKVRSSQHGNLTKQNMFLWENIRPKSDKTYHICLL